MLKKNALTKQALQLQMYVVGGHGLCPVRLPQYSGCSSREKPDPSQCDLHVVSYTLRQFHWMGAVYSLGPLFQNPRATPVDLVTPVRQKHKHIQVPIALKLGTVR